MRTILLWAMVLPHFMGCNTADGIGYTPELRGCTLIGGVTAIGVNITSPDPLPPNLAIALNGKDVDIDECNPGKESPVPNMIRLNNDRTHATIYFYFYENPEDIDFYFPEGNKGPTSNAIDLIFYSRANCTDPLTQIQEISDNNGISWEPGYVNGEHCGVTGYTGEFHIDL